MVSDLEDSTSYLTGLRRDESGLRTIDIDRNTYGWSAEEVLLEVFNVPTTRNYYLADKIGEILEMVSVKSRDEQKISWKVKELVEKNVIELSSNDPLYSVWKKLVEKYG